MNNNPITDAVIGRRSFMKRVGLPDLMAAPVGAMLTSQPRARAATSGPRLSAGDTAMLRFLAALLAALPLIYAQERGDRGESGSGGGAVARNEPARMPEERSSGFVDRSNHGSIRHYDTNVAQPYFAAPRNAGAQHKVLVNRDVDADVNVRRYWSAFSFGARQHRLRAGSLRLLVNNVPYFYDDGIYYQQEGDDYQEVYPPVGADIPQPPDGAVEIDAGGLAYYYAGGGFYVEQGGGFVIAPTPIGVIVPELPPGSVQVAYNNGVAYQFNGVYYQPVVVDGVTQYMTVLPNPQAND